MSAGIPAKDVMKFINDDPDGFLVPGFDKQRDSKNSSNKYMDNCIKTGDGKKKRLKISWKMVPLEGGVKAPEDRKYGPTIAFRESSGDIGKATVATYSKFSEIVSEKLSNGEIKARKNRANICSIVQKELDDGTELDDPIFRFKLPFNDKGKPEFKLVRIEEDEEGNPKPVNVNCTVDNVHTIIKGRMLTSGFVTMDTVVFSGFGISIPARVQLLVIKPVANETPDVESILSRDEMLEMVGDPGEEEDDAADDEDGDVAIDDPANPETENQLEALQKLAIEAANDGDTEDANDESDD